MNPIVSPVKSKKGGPRSLTASVIGALSATFCLLLFLLLIGTTFAYSREDPAALIPSVAYAIGLIAALFCGFTAARMRGKQGFLCGLLSGLALLVIFLIGLLIFMEEEGPSPSLLLFYPLLLALSVLGGMLGGRKRSGRRRRHSHSSR